MESSLAVPTATSVRAVPARLLEDNRTVVNRQLARARGGKVSFTHLIGFAIVQAAAEMPVMNGAYATEDGKPAVVHPDHVNLGLAIDLVKGSQRQLVVPNIKSAETLDFALFWSAYEDLVRRARAGRLTADDFAGTTITLTNPGGIGTVHSVPRLMAGQGAIIGVGAMEYPAEFRGAAPETLARLAVSKVLTLTSTYDHRIIQGAQSGEFLRRVDALLLGADRFYDRIFASLRIPYEPVRWVDDIPVTHEGDLDKGSRVMELIHAYRVRGHLMADTDPLEFKIRSHPDLDIVEHGLTLWDLDREFPVGGFAGHARCGCATSSPSCAIPTAAGSASSTCTSRTRTSANGSSTGSSSPASGPTPPSSCTSSNASTRPKPSRPSCTPSTWGRSGSRWRAASRSSRSWTRSCAAPSTRALTRSPSGCRTADGSTSSPTSSASRTARSSGSSRAGSTRTPPTVPATSNTTSAPKAASTPATAGASPCR